MQSTTPQVQIQTGYCTNVHAGRDLTTVLENLKKHSLPVRDSLVQFRKQHSKAGSGEVDSRLGLGLWFSEKSVRDTLQEKNLQLLKDFLADEQIRPYTLNGFPQTDFHEPVVKHRVYLPTWHDPTRLEYTLLLVNLLDQLLPEGEMGSISTMPIAWGEPGLTSDQTQLVADNWMTLARRLHSLYEETGRTILVAIEPEPGCLLTDSQSFRQFYVEEFLHRLKNEQDREIARNHITLCHDVCHAAVMYEDQEAELKASFDQGIRVGKVQVSSAFSIDWSTLNDQQRGQAWSQLQNFDEVRYLHQVHIQDGGKREMIDDLPDIFSKQKDAPNSGEWRVHFHVPVFIDQMGAIRSTQSEIVKCLNLLVPKVGSYEFPTGHFEVETYAWTVLPEGLKSGSLSDGIAKEMEWFEELLADHSPQDQCIGLPC